jgi:steroid 5-alpha reductase family enzyme
MWDLISNLPWPPNPWAVLSWQGVMVFLVLTNLWWVSVRLKNAGIVDLYWALGFVLLALLDAWLLPGWHLRRAVICTMLAIANVRLGLYLIKRFIHEFPVEDARYAGFRHDWAKRFSPTGAHGMMLGAFYLQGALQIVVQLPVWWACQNTTVGFNGLEIAAIGLWLMAVLGEAVADNQLAAFKANPVHQGKTCQIGLWRYSRHPNYFCQWLLWVAYWLFACGTPLPGLGWGGLTVLSPLLMLLFLTRVTGVAATEAHARESRIDYAEYQRTTSAFIPWWPKT